MAMMLQWIITGLLRQASHQDDQTQGQRRLVLPSLHGYALIVVSLLLLRRHPHLVSAVAGEKDRMNPISLPLHLLPQANRININAR